MNFFPYFSKEHTENIYTHILRSENAASTFSLYYKNTAMDIVVTSTTQCKQAGKEERKNRALARELHVGWKKRFFFVCDESTSCINHNGEKINK